MSTGLIATAELNAQLDDLCKAYRKLYGTSASGFGMGEPGDAFGCATNLAALVTSINGSGNLDETDDLEAIARTLVAAMSAKNILGAYANPLILAYGAHAYKFQPNSTVVSLDTLLTYLNTSGGSWTALQDSYFRDIYYAARKSYPSVWNLYFEVLQGAYTTGLDHLYTNGLGKFVVSGAGAGTFTKPVLEGLLVTDGGGFGTIDSSKFAGGVPQARVSGLAGSGTLTVTGNFYDRLTKAVIVGATITFNIVASAVNSTVTGGTAPAAALLIVATNMSIAAGITAGTIYMEGARPAGRPLIS